MFVNVSVYTVFSKKLHLLILTFLVLIENLTNILMH